MENPNLSYQRDKSIVIAIIKYILFAVIAAIIIFFMQKLVLILFPFLIGYFLAKISRRISGKILILWDKLTKRDRREEKKTTVKKESILHSKSKVLQRIFPQGHKRHMSRNEKVTIFIYVLLLILTLTLLVLGVTALVMQVNKGINHLATWIKALQEDATQNENAQITDIINRFTVWLSQFSRENGGFLGTDEIDSILSDIRGIPQKVISSLPSLLESIQRISKPIFSSLGNLPILLFSLIVMLMSGYYFIVEKQAFLQFFIRNVKSHSFRRKVFTLFNRLSETLFRVLGGYILLLIITFFESFILFLICGINYAMIWALVTAVLDFMPVIGVSATIIPLIIYSMIHEQYGVVLTLLIGWLVINMIRRIIEPPILGNAMRIHPMATLFAMILGVALWGVVGFILGPVVFLVALESSKTFGVDQKLRTFFGRVLNKI